MSNEKSMYHWYLRPRSWGYFILLFGGLMAYVYVPITILLPYGNILVDIILGIAIPVMIRKYFQIKALDRINLEKAGYEAKQRYFAKKLQEFEHFCFENPYLGLAENQYYESDAHVWTKDNEIQQLIGFEMRYHLLDLAYGAQPYYNQNSNF